MGSGGLVVMDSGACMVDVARYFLDFARKESCGKCIPCRLGTSQMLDILEDIVSGKGRPGDIDLLCNIGEGVKKGSLCGLGQTAPNPVLSTLRYFPDEYRAHVEDRLCPTLNCSALVDVSIDKSNCIKCRLCIKNCPVEAISEEFVVDNNVCTRCDTCIDICPKNTVFRVKRGEGERG